MTLRTASKELHEKIQTFFYRVGYTVAGHPKKTIFLTIVGFIICCAGFQSFHSEKRLEKLWIPQGTLALDHKNWVSENFVFGVRPDRIIVTSAEEGGDVANLVSLLQLIKLLRVSTNTKVQVDGEELELDDLCIRSTNGRSSYCAMTSILDLFYDQTLVQSTFLDTVETKLLTLSDEQIKSIIGDVDNYQRWNGGRLNPEDFLSGLSGSGNTTTVQAFHVVLLLENNEAVVAGESLDFKAVSWVRTSTVVGEISNVQIGKRVD